MNAPSVVVVKNGGSGNIVLGQLGGSIDITLNLSMTTARDINMPTNEELIDEIWASDDNEILCPREDECESCKRLEVLILKALNLARIDTTNGQYED